MDVHDRWRPFLIYEMLAKGLGVHFLFEKFLPITLGMQSEVSGDSS